MNRSSRLVALAACSAVACTVASDPNAPRELPKPSTDFTTTQIYPSSSAQDDGTTLSVYAALLYQGKYLSLASTDRLVARVGAGPELVLAAQGQTYDPHYVATIASPMLATDVVLTLDRAGTDGDASVHLHLPATFDLDGTPPSALKQNVGFDVATLPPPIQGDGAWWAALDGTCVKPGTVATATFSAGKLHFILNDQAIDPNQSATSCAVTVKIQHVYFGEADAAFVKPVPNDTVALRERRFSATLAR